MLQGQKQVTWGGGGSRGGLILFGWGLPYFYLDPPAYMYGFFIGYLKSQSTIKVTV